ncbi:hypothetical protein MNEG_5179, partial [Monoraphidium neglectum]
MLHVLGAGSIGCLFAHHIARAGLPITLLLRADALRAFDGVGRVVRCGDDVAACGAEQVDAAQGGGQQQIRNLLVTTK